MRAYSLTHLSDDVLLRDLAAAIAHERCATAAVLAHIAEVDDRKLYVPAGFPSMHAFCVGELRMSEDAAFKRIQAARAARRFPVLFAALADGRLHLTGLGLLVPHLTEGNLDDLVAAATNKTKSEIAQLLAERFPRPELMEMMQVMPAGMAAPQLAPAQVDAPAVRARLAPVAPGRFELQFTIGKGTREKLEYAQALLSHRVPSGDVAQVFDRALDALIGQLEKRKFAATRKPRPRHQASTRERHIPADVKRAVWQRDQGRCTFVSETGRRCRARKFVEFDHVEPVARGGQATVEGLRLRCRAHNQYEAEQAFGVEFMRHKREAAREAASDARVRVARAEASAGTDAQDQDQAQDLMAGLRELGFRADQARRAAEFSVTVPDAGLEQRMRAALQFLCPKTGRS